LFLEFTFYNQVVPTELKLLERYIYKQFVPTGLIIYTLKNLYSIKKQMQTLLRRSILFVTINKDIHSTP